MDALQKQLVGRARKLVDLVGKRTDRDELEVGSGRLTKKHRRTLSGLVRQEENVKRRFSSRGRRDY